MHFFTQLFPFFLETRLFHLSFFSLPPKLYNLFLVSVSSRSHENLSVTLTPYIQYCNITHWAHKNHLKLNLAKSQEIIFVDKRRKANFSAPAIIPGLQRVQVLKILGVTLTNGLSVSLHVQNVITTCAQTLYALRVVRAHGLCDNAL